MTEKVKVRRYVPRGPRLLIRKGAEEEVTPGGIHLPAATQEKGESKVGVILEVGQGIWSDAKGIYMGSKFEKGQKVFYFKHGAIDLEKAWAGEEKLAWIDETQVQGVIEEG
jgi:co-chaperonin GroES (HSP10)